MPGLTIVIRDQRGEEPTEEVFVHDGGISEFCEFLAPDPAVTDVWRLQGSGTFTETVPVLDAKGHMSAHRGRARVRGRRRGAVGHRLRHPGHLVRQHHRHPKGGTHLAGFDQALLKVLRRQLELNARRLKVGSDKLEKDDVLAGLTAVVTVRLAEPQFEGQTKEVLGTNAVRAIVARVVEKELTERLVSTKRGEKQQAALLLEKVTSEMKSRISARLHKETQRRKTALESSTLPAKLADCRSTDVERTELFIVEGDSALGTAKGGPAAATTRRCCRSAARSSTSRRPRSPTCSATPSARRSSRSSGPVGAHLRPRVGPLRQGHHHDRRRRRRRPHPHPAAHPVLPVHAPAGRGRPGLRRGAAAAPHRGGQPGSKANEVIYTYSEAEMRRTMASLTKRGKKIKPLQRYKGLGEMDADQLAETTMDPHHRTLRKVTAADLDSPPASSSCSWAATSARARTSSSTPPTPSTASASTSERGFLCPRPGAAAPVRSATVGRGRRPASGRGREGTMSATVEHDERHVEGEERTEPEAGDRPEAAPALHHRGHPGHGVYALTGRVAQRGRGSGLGAVHRGLRRSRSSRRSATSSS